MKPKSWIKYFIYMCSILTVIFLGQHVFEVINQNFQKTYIFNPYYMNGMMIICNGGIGLLLGLEHLICEIKKQGTWVINLPKLVLMGMPSLLFSLAIIIYYNFKITVPPFLLRLLMQSNLNFINVFQIILGYSIITSFYKTTETI